MHGIRTPCSYSLPCIIVHEMLLALTFIPLQSSNFPQETVQEIFDQANVTAELRHLKYIVKTIFKIYMNLFI